MDLASTLDELGTLLIVVVPLLLIAEMTATYRRGQFSWRHFRIPLLILLCNTVLGRIISLSIAVVIASALRPYALLETSLNWYWFIFGYVVWEFSHFVYHFLAHKVRILWCLHSTHHAPEHMNLSVSYSHFFLEGHYADLVRIGICTVVGIDPVVLMIVVGIDSIWGSVIHVGEEIIPDGRMGKMEKLILTPAHHRLHHSRNPYYIDTNFCNLLNIWDRLFGTYKELEPGKAPEYGIKRPIDIDSFSDLYLGEFVALYRDIRGAPRWRDKLRYLVMPPDWRHDRTPAGLR